MKDAKGRPGHNRLAGVGSDYGEGSNEAPLAVDSPPFYYEPSSSSSSSSSVSILTHHSSSSSALDHPLVQSDSPHLQDRKLESENHLRFTSTSIYYRDKLFLLLFFLQLLLLVILAAIYGSRFMNDPQPSSTDYDPNHAESLRKTSWVGILVSGLVASSVFSTVWLFVIQRFSFVIVKLSVVTCLTVLVLSAVVSFFYGLIPSGVLYIVLSLLCGWWWWYVRNRIAFAQTVLHSAVQSIRHNKGPIYIVYLLAAIQLLFFAFWFFTFVSIYYDWVVQSQLHPSSVLPHPFFICFTLFSFFWVTTTFQYIGHCTTSGSVATFWLQPNHVSPTRSSFVRACTTSLGSLMFASLFVAFLTFIHWLLHTLQTYAPCCVNWILNSLDRVLRIFNKYTLAQIAIYGHDFMSAGRETKKLFSAELFNVIVNDNLCTLCWLMGCFISGVFTGTIASLWAAGLGESRWLFVAWIASIIGFSVTELFMSVIDSAITTTFVCWRLDPAALKANQPEAFARITEAAGERYVAMGHREEEAQL